MKDFKEHVNEVDTNEDLSGIATADTKEEPKTDEWQKAKVVTGNGNPLNLRSDPDKRGTVLTQIPDGATIQTKVFDIKWVAVKYNGFEGFCMRDFVK